MAPINDRKSHGFHKESLFPPRNFSGSSGLLSDYTICSVSRTKADKASRREGEVLKFPGKEIFIKI